MPKTSLIRYTFSQSSMLTVQGGSGLKTESFAVHESFLTSRSEYSKRALNSNWNEATTRVVPLTHEEPAVFALYLNHLCTGRLPTVQKSRQELGAMQRSAAIRFLREELYQLARVYVLAERLQDITARNAVTDAFVHVHNGYLAPTPSALVIMLTFDSTPPGRPIGRLLVDSWAHKSLLYVLERASQLPKDFLNDLGLVLEKHRIFSRVLTQCLWSFHYIEAETAAGSQDAPVVTPV
ncbi:uncharacterized protein M421DRAFT_92051 [Didymella exigua CBS 183.55]|uniref:BTB domain-containing protein n=1 Tax=Didymella exigua CBS 183.55 TaxID=1150837 RepID=A0A6A5RU93_9PLEO|nr:uncharacterized protein M421DRAFT_92051 [Didymella exigua CBS 183.55]KAF1928927.1 hypothetical protein M421DRAFT_92051 [Didymella exigua CBS 183.55]